MEKDYSTKERNKTIDIIRAFAILMVILGHTISGSSKEFENTLLYQVIWTLQMPLFFVISGYLCKYRKATKSFEELLKRLGKKTMAYLFPWLVWTVVIRGIIFGQNSFLNLLNLLYHMDSGYWFLFAIWAIASLLDIASFIGVKIFKSTNNIQYILLVCFIMVLFTIALLSFGYLISFDFLCVKLIIYYIPIYFLGFLFGKIDEKLAAMNNYKLVAEIISAVSGIVYLLLINHINFFSLNDNGMNIILRYVCSVLGCITFCWYTNKTISLISNRYLVKLIWVGQHTLEIYVIHYLFLNVIITEGTLFSFASIQGFWIVMSNYLINLILTIFFVWILEKNSVTKKVLFWKQ